jgi:LacI family transcriptional regulator
MAKRPDSASAPGHDSDQERPTLKTIAAATGLAIATVSRALNDAPDIGDETKRRVRETATQLGYRPNRAGVRLRTGKTNVIALVLSTESDMMNHTSRLIYSIAAVLRGTAYHVVIMPYFPDQDPMEPIRYLVETGSADGIVLNQIQPVDPRVRYLIERNFPFATHGRTNMDIPHVYFDFDNEAYARIAVQALAQRGRRQLCLLPPPRDHNYSSHMITGFADECALRGLRFEIIETVTSDSPGEKVEAALEARMRSADPPDGILVGSAHSAMAAIMAAENVGRTLGRDFDLVAKEAIPVLRRFRKNIIIVHEDVGRAGDFLARALMRNISAQGGMLEQHLDIPTGVELGPSDQGELA